MKKEKKDREKVLLLLSGGRDSFLAACRLIESGYHVAMVTYDNGCSIQSNRAQDVAERIISVYGEERASYLGVHSIIGYNHEFYPEFYNLKPSEIAKRYGEITCSQFNCLVCRTSMYMCSINICRQQGIHIIAEGARKVQGFVIELDEMIERYKDLLKKFEIELKLPVYELDSENKRKHELLKRGFLPKTYEAQCVLGVPLKNSVDTSVIQGVLNFYDKEIAVKALEIIEEAKDITWELNDELLK